MCGFLQTYYSSFLFAPVSYFAALKGIWIVAVPFNLVFGTSILHHGKYFEDYPGKYAVYVVDKVLAHFIVGATATLAMRKMLVVGWSPALCAYWTGLAWITYVYYIAKRSHLPGRTWIPWHVSLHAAAAAGTVALLTEF